MFIEEKRYRATPKPYQWQLFHELDIAHSGRSMYRGFHLLQFEYTQPEDGLLWLDWRSITIADLYEFLCFEKTKGWYNSVESIHKGRTKRVV